MKTPSLLHHLHCKLWRRKIPYISVCSLTGSRPPLPQAGREGRDRGQSMVPQPHAALQEAEHGCHAMGGSNGSPFCSRGKGSACFLILQEIKASLCLCSPGGVVALLPSIQSFRSPHKELHTKKANQSTALCYVRKHSASHDCIKKPAFLGHICSVKGCTVRSRH